MRGRFLCSSILLYSATLLVQLIVFCPPSLSRFLRDLVPLLRRHGLEALPPSDLAALATNLGHVLRNQFWNRPRPVILNFPRRVVNRFASNRSRVKRTALSLLNPL